MGCPNLPIDLKNDKGEKGCIFVAIKGHGAFQVRIIFILFYFFLFYCLYPNN